MSVIKGEGGEEREEGTKDVNIGGRY